MLREQYVKMMEPDESNLPNGTDEGFDRADFRVEFSPSPNLESPQFQPRDNATRSVNANSTPETSSPPRARTNSDGESLLLSLTLTLAPTLALALTLTR